VNALNNVLIELKMKPNAQLDEKTAFIAEVSKIIDNLQSSDEVTLKKCCFALGGKLKVLFLFFLFLFLFFFFFLGFILVLDLLLFYALFFGHLSHSCFSFFVLKKKG
jgi:hypothetical protein